MPMTKRANQRSYANRLGFIAKNGGAPAKPANTAVPTITGTPKVGVTLTATNGTWTGKPVPKFTRQWFAAGVAIAGATGTTFVPAAGHVGKAITVVVTGASIAGSTAKASAATAVVAAA